MNLLLLLKCKLFESYKKNHTSCLKTWEEQKQVIHKMTLIHNNNQETWENNININTTNILKIKRCFFKKWYYNTCEDVAQGSLSTLLIEM